MLLPRKPHSRLKALELMQGLLLTTRVGRPDRKYSQEMAIDTSE